MHVFDESLELTPHGETRLSGTLDRRWWIHLGPNGGFLSSLCLKALQHVVGDIPPRTLSVHFPGRAQEGPVQFEVSVDRQGRTFTFASGRMYQEGKILSSFLGAFAPARDALTFDDAPIPDVEAPEAIEELIMPEELIPEFSRNFDYRPASTFLPFSGADRAIASSWIRLKQARTIDALEIPTIADSIFPAVFVKLDSFAGTPTIDLTVHFRATLPLEYDWLLGSFETRYASEGFIEEDGRIWARDGRLLAQSRQLVLLHELPLES